MSILGSDEIEAIKKFHEVIFGEKRNSGVLFQMLKEDPETCFTEALHVGSIPNLQTMETGFLIGICFMYNFHNNQLVLQKMMDGITISQAIQKGVSVGEFNRPQN